MDCCVFPVFMALLRYFSLPGRSHGAHRFCSLKVLFCCEPGQPHGSALFVQTVERFAPPVTRGKPGIPFFSVVREGVADKPQALFVLDWRGLGSQGEPPVLPLVAEQPLIK